MTILAESFDDPLIFFDDMEEKKNCTTMDIAMMVAALQPDSVADSAADKDVESKRTLDAPATTTTATTAADATSEEDNATMPPPPKRIKHQQEEAENEEEPSSTSRRVRCKARGLSKAHNIETAYFEIPKDAPHGMLLCCSHPECQVSARAFRYCKGMCEATIGRVGAWVCSTLHFSVTNLIYFPIHTECALPVAKRNFLRRHGHGLAISSRSLKEDIDKARIKFVERTGCLPVSSFEEQRNKSPTSTTVVELDVPQEQSLQLSDEEQEWLSLLHRRPETQDKSKMSTWVGQVLDYHRGAHQHPPDNKVMADIQKSSGAGDASSSLDYDVLEGLGFFSGEQFFFSQTSVDPL